MKRPSFRTPKLLQQNVSVARALSKLGYCSRTEASGLIKEGRVSIAGRTVRDEAKRVNMAQGAIAVDGMVIRPAKKVYLMVNKARGLLTTRSDPEGRRTVYDCLAGLDLPSVIPVGRLDKASEGLLLMTNDTWWAQQVLDPASCVAKVYHVHVSGLLREHEADLLCRGVEADGEHLSASSVEVLRSGVRNCWLRMVLTEGKNRQIRRMINTLNMDVLRLVRVQIGSLRLGDLASGSARCLSARERNMILDHQPEASED